MWTHERGSLHYDVMVTLILAFVFLSPVWVDFKDKPAERIPHPSEVVVTPNQERGFIYQFDLPNDAMQGEPGDVFRKAIEPIAGEVVIDRYEVVRRKVGTTTYRVWVRRL